LSAVADFYSRHPITVYVASRLTGGYGTYAQTLAAHLPKHIPGNPNVICEPMEQEAGLRLTQALADGLPRDGTAIGAIQGANTVESLLNPDVTFDTRRLKWIGSISRQNNTVITWHTSDIRTIEDARRREVIAGAETEVSNTGTMGNILNGLLGTRFKTLYGYDLVKLHHALEAGEVEAVCGWGYATLMAAHADWLEGNKINIIVHTGLEPDPMMPEVPCIIDFARTEEDRKVIRLMDTRTALGRPYAAPLDVPEDRLGALRAGFAATLQDPAFLAEAKTRRLVIDPMDHVQMAATIDAAYALEPAVVRRTWALLNGKRP
jgi:hypothetical protein